MVSFYKRFEEDKRNLKGAHFFSLWTKKVKTMRATSMLVHFSLWQRHRAEGWDEISSELKGGCIISVLNNFLLKVIPLIPAFIGWICLFWVQ